MIERFGKDTVIALAAVEGGVPYVRSVNAYYENGAFYIRRVKKLCLLGIAAALLNL